MTRYILPRAKHKLTVVTMAATLMATLLIGATSAWAGPKHMLKELDLTVEQKAQVKELRQQQKAQRESLKESLQDKHKALHERRRALLQNYSEAEANAIADEVAALARQKATLRMAGEKALFEILSDEQRAKYLSMMEQHKGRMHGAGMHKGLGKKQRHCDAMELHDDQHDDKEEA